MVHGWRIALVLISGLLGASAAHAESGKGARSEHPIGIGAMYSSGPFWMGQLNINLADFLRIGGGYGEKKVEVAGVTEKVKISVTTVGGALYVPGLPVSPFVGGDYAIGKASVTVTAGGRSTTVEAKVTGLAAKAGLDFTTEGGLNFGAVKYFGDLDGVGLYGGIYF